MLPASVEELQQEEGAVSWLVISPLGAVVAYRERNWSAAASLTMLEYVCWSLFRGRKDLDPRLWRQIKDMEVARRIRTIKIGIDGAKENNMFVAPSVYWTSFWPRRRMGHRIIESFSVVPKFESERWCVCFWLPFLLTGPGLFLRPSACIFSMESPRVILLILFVCSLIYFNILLQQSCWKKTAEAFTVLLDCVLCCTARNWTIFSKTELVAYVSRIDYKDACRAASDLKAWARTFLVSLSLFWCCAGRQLPPSCMNPVLATQYSCVSAII